jgi:hypothetical protein
MLSPWYHSNATLLVALRSRRGAQTSGRGGGPTFSQGEGDSNNISVCMSALPSVFMHSLVLPWFTKKIRQLVSGSLNYLR